MTWLKEAAVEAYVTVCSGDGRRVRAADLHQQRRCQPETDESHIRSALRWLCRAHDIGTDDGVAAMFSVVEGWLGSYPETTGYIIPTFFDAAELFNDEQLRDRAVEMADWLLTLQLPDGAFPGSFVERLTGPRVFNTGQIIFGLIQAANETGEIGYLESAMRAGDWLVSVQDSDGAWRTAALEGVARAYNVRTAWALHRLSRVAGELRFRHAALANAEWAVARQCESGWFERNAFSADADAANLHTLCYCVRGLLEIGALEESHEPPSAGFVASARKAADALFDLWQRGGALAGSFQADWSSPAHWRCIPGEAQLAIVWMRLDQISGERRFTDAAIALLEQVKAAQFVAHQNPDLDGGVSGSLPINAPYERYCLVNWGPKFLIDALILKGRRHGEHPIG